MLHLLFCLVTDEGAKGYKAAAASVRSLHLMLHPDKKLPHLALSPPKLSNVYALLIFCSKLAANCTPLMANLTPVLPPH